MASKQTIQQKAVILIIQLMFCQFLFAQSETRILLPEQDSLRLNKYNLFDDLSGTNWLFSSPFPAFRTTPPKFDFAKENLSKTFSVLQGKFGSVFPGLGSTEHFHNQFRWNAGNKVTVDFGPGLALQNTILNPVIPNYQLSFRASFEYSINDWLSAYFYGQYITRPINKTPDYFDPFIHNNPLFLQNEIGTGLKAKYKNKYIDFRIFSIYGSGYNDIKPVHSKIRIGF